MIGVKRSTEAEGFQFLRKLGAVGECSYRAEGKGVTHTGALRSKNVGTSNHNAGEIPARRKIKDSLAMTISQGLVGPKEMTKVASDGHMVNIP